LDPFLDQAAVNLFVEVLRQLLLHLAQGLANDLPTQLLKNPLLLAGQLFLSIGPQPLHFPLRLLQQLLPTGFGVGFRLLADTFSLLLSLGQLLLLLRQPLDGFLFALLRLPQFF
jgi:hypothetical protein